MFSGDKEFGHAQYFESDLRMYEFKEFLLNDNQLKGRSFKIYPYSLDSASYVVGADPIDLTKLLSQSTTQSSVHDEVTTDTVIRFAVKFDSPLSEETLEALLSQNCVDLNFTRNGGLIKSRI
ncbi:hypothetical protein GGF41_005700 [Coemansia sp. RSA 2531]|nr:hypothetical protein GGF41_005700 [Coemansia sp. RSA 2531]